MSLKIQSIKITTILITRRPMLIRVWRTDGLQLTSHWILTPHTNLNDEEGSACSSTPLPPPKPVKPPTTPKTHQTSINIGDLYFQNLAQSPPPTH